MDGADSKDCYYNTSIIKQTVNVASPRFYSLSALLFSHSLLCSFPPAFSGPIKTDSFHSNWQQHRWSICTPQAPVCAYVISGCQERYIFERQQDGPVVKGACCQLWRPEFDPLGHDGTRRELRLEVVLWPPDHGMCAFFSHNLKMYFFKKPRKRIGI